jgi:hypothetical protein
MRVLHRQRRNGANLALTWDRGVTMHGLTLPERIDSAAVWTKGILSLVRAHVMLMTT